MSHALDLVKVDGHGRLWWWSCLLLRCLHKYVESMRIGKRHPFFLKQRIKDIYQKYQLIEKKLKIQCWIECFVSCFKVNLSPEKYHTYQMPNVRYTIIYYTWAHNLKLNILRDQGNGTWSFCFSVLGLHIKLAQVGWWRIRSCWCRSMCEKIASKNLEG